MLASHAGAERVDSLLGESREDVGIRDDDEVGATCDLHNLPNQVCTCDALSVFNNLYAVGIDLVEVVPLCALRGMPGDPKYSCWFDSLNSLRLKI